jgi:hypothetical protein
MTPDTIHRTKQREAGHLGATGPADNGSGGAAEPHRIRSGRRSYRDYLVIAMRCA